MQQFTHQLTVSTHGKGFYEITEQVQNWLGDLNVGTGLVTIFIQHTSASLVIQENADPDVVRDLESFFSRLVLENDPLYTHTTEGPDDMPAHVRAALTQTQLSVPLRNGSLSLGTWQGIYVFEHRRHPHRRHVVLHAMGE